MTDREKVREQIAELAAPYRAYCDVCESYVHECGCNPSVAVRIGRHRADRILALMDTEGERCEAHCDGCRCKHAKAHDGLHYDGIMYWPDEDSVTEGEKPEPVGWAAMENGVCIETSSATANEDTDETPEFFLSFWEGHDTVEIVPLYTHPPLPEGERIEGVAYRSGLKHWQLWEHEVADDDMGRKERHATLILLAEAKTVCPGCNRDTAVSPHNPLCSTFAHNRTMEAETDGK